MGSAAVRSIESLRSDFPCLSQAINERPLAYLDSAASAQKPTSVIEATSEFYSNHYANVHRGVHTLSQRATDMFEATRAKVATILNAPDVDSVIFTKGCTEGINLVAQCWGATHLRPGDEILLTEMEHHSNIVPWQLIAERTGAVVRAIPVTDMGEVDLDAFRSMLSEKVKVVGIVHISNAIGTINPVEEMAALAKEVGAMVLIDGAQAGPHHTIDVQAIGCDFYTLSCHKIYAPTGVGILWGRRELLEAMPPYQGGGSMIRSVSFEKTTYAALPDKYEPGTPNVAGFVGFGAALDYVATLGQPTQTWSRADWLSSIARIAEHERRLSERARQELAAIEGVRLIGNATARTGIVSFVMEDVHPHDVGQILDAEGVAIRVGHHCCQPLMRRFDVPSTNRASFALYSTEAEVNQLAAAVRRAKEMLG
jgi:cysteine desulfurase/selenocysteine lyase